MPDVKHLDIQTTLQSLPSSRIPETDKSDDPSPRKFEQLGNFSNGSDSRCSGLHALLHLAGLKHTPCIRVNALIEEIDGVEGDRGLGRAGSLSTRI
jgi:hypothetical protein